MAIVVKMYDTVSLLGVMQQMEPVPTYFTDLCFTKSINSEDEYIDFEKVFESRKLAPLVAPGDKGKPIFTENSRVKRIKPAYIKLLDPVNPSRVIARRPGELTAKPMSPEQRGNAIVADILREHRNSVERRTEWMATEAVLNGTITLTGDDYPTVVVDFERDAGHTIDLNDTGLVTWDGTGADIIGNLNDWRTTVRRAQFGGVTNRLTLGPDAWDVMSKDVTVQKQLDTQLRGTQANFNTGLRAGEEIEYVGRIGSLDLWINSSYYQNSSGTAVPYMNAKDVVLTGPGLMGHRCYGAILDKKAQYHALPVFTKMYEEENPSVTNVLTQSSPLMVPLNPNCSLKARVVS